MVVIRAVLTVVGALAFILGAGIGWGGALSSWRYGDAAGFRRGQFLRWSARWGWVIAIGGLAVVGLALVL
jgi:hypothetical protein